MTNKLKSYWDGFTAIVYPKMCLACGQPLVRGEEFVCSECMYHIPRTDYHLNKENMVAQLFYGRIDLVFATSYFGFDKGGILQKLMHHLKYKGEKGIGEILGKHLGMGLKQSPFLPPLDCIIPVPLHKKRLRKRGYNQSEHIAIGMASVLNVPVNTSTLIRTTYKSSQTKLTKEERWKNVSDNFMINSKQQLNNKHVLIVDDVLTTGATIEACYNALSTIEGIRISVATLARA